MRSYIRLYNQQGQPRWAVITTDNQGYDDWIWASTLIQSLKLNINESPFYANYGLPSVQSVLQQIPPDSYVANLQSLFSGYFASLIVSRTSAKPPTYNISLTTQQGVQLQLDQLDGESYAQYAVTEGRVPGVTDGGVPIIVG